MLLSASSLRQLRRIRRSLDDDSAATLVQAFVASRVDYWQSLDRCAKEDDRQSCSVFLFSILRPESSPTHASIEG